MFNGNKPIHRIWVETLFQSFAEEAIQSCLTFLLKEGRLYLLSLVEAQQRFYANGSIIIIITLLNTSLNYFKKCFSVGV